MHHPEERKPRLIDGLPVATVGSVLYCYVPETATTQFEVAHWLRTAGRVWVHRRFSDYLQRRAALVVAEDHDGVDRHPTVRIESDALRVVRAPMGHSTQLLEELSDSPDIDALALMPDSGAASDMALEISKDFPTHIRRITRIRIGIADGHHTLLGDLPPPFDHQRDLRRHGAEIFDRMGVAWDPMMLRAIVRDFDGHVEDVARFTAHVQQRMPRW